MPKKIQAVVKGRRENNLTTSYTLFLVKRVGFALPVSFQIKAFLYFFHDFPFIKT